MTDLWMSKFFVRLGAVLVVTGVIRCTGIGSEILVSAPTIFGPWSISWKVLSEAAKHVVLIYDCPL